MADEKKKSRSETLYDKGKKAAAEKPAKKSEENNEGDKPAEGAKAAERGADASPLKAVYKRHEAERRDHHNGNRDALRKMAERHEREIAEAMGVGAAEGAEAEAALRHALSEKPSAELRKRAEVLLSKPGFTLSPEGLRQTRAIRALELIGTEAAQKLLQQLASGSKWAVLTQDARDALERLQRRTR